MQSTAVSTQTKSTPLYFGSYTCNTASVRRFYDRFKAEYFDLIKRYEMDEDDNIWLNTYKLKEIGVDIESWNRDGETE